MNDIAIESSNEIITNIDFDKLNTYKYEALVDIRNKINGLSNVTEDEITELNKIISYEEEKINRLEYLNEIGLQISEKEDEVTGLQFYDFNNSSKYRISYIASIIVSVFLIPFALFALIMFISLIFGLLPEEPTIMTYLSIALLSGIGYIGIKLFFNGIQRFKMNENFKVRINKSEIEVTHINNNVETYSKNEYQFSIKKENGNYNLYLDSEQNSISIFNSKFSNLKYQKTFETFVQKLNNL